MQINLGSGTLESLERDLLPLAIDNPQKKIYRRLLVELYESLTFTLIQHVRHGAVEDLDAGRAALARVGQRAIKPLLDALADDDEGQQRVAIDVLSYVQNKNAGPALFSFATGPSTTPLRVRAMIACGVLESVALLPRYLRYLFPPRTDGSADSLPSDAVAVAAAWSVARMEEPGALPLLRELMRRGNPEMRAFGVLGLGRLRDVASIGEIARIAKSPDSGNVSRAAAAYTLGELGADSEIPALVAMAEGNEVLPREMALVALSRLQLAHGANRAAVAAMADAVFAGGESDDSRVRSRVSAVHRAGSAALMLLAAGRPGLARLSHSALPVPDGTVNVQAELEHLVPDGFASTERALTLTMFGGELERAALRAMETSSGGAWAVIDALGEGDNTLLPFVGPGDTFEAARVEAGRIARTLDSALVRRATDPDPAMKIRAIALLGHMVSDTATTAIAAATRDSNEDVVRAALTAIGEQWSPRALDGVVGVLRRQGPFSLRVLAVEALGRLGAVGGGQEAARALGEVAVRDEFALVREAALTSLAGFDRTGARRVAAQLIATDPELHVRAAARSILDEAEP
jgi:HEAT repeat protein